MSNKYFSSGYLKAKPESVNSEKGFISRVKVCTAGEALGHSVSLDNEFIDKVIDFGNEKKQGLKARFGHPSMCSTSLGTFLGRFKNFRAETTSRVSGEQAYTAVADLFLSNEAKNTPNGDLFSYVSGMAENESDMFGTSIVFAPGKEYRKNESGEKVFAVDDYDGEDELSEELFVECSELFACDCVDDPAANDGMFSKFAKESIAGQISEFLDTNPEVVTALSDNPEVIEVLAKYGKNVDGFFAKYQTYKKQEALKMSKKTKKDLNSDEPKVELEAGTVEEPIVNEPEAANEPELEPEVIADEPALEAAPIDRAELQSLNDEFGADIALKVALSGGGKAEAYKLKAEATDAKMKELESENEELKTQAASEGGDPAELSEEVKPKVLPWAKK